MGLKMITKERTNACMAWLSDTFAPAMQRIISKPWIAAVSSAMQKNLPFILCGSLVFLYGVVRDFIAGLPDLWVVAQFTFGLLGILTAFNVANQVMEKLNHQAYTTNAGLVAIAVHIMFSMPKDGMIDLNRLGASGILVGMISGIFVSGVFHMIAKRNMLENSNLPDFIIGWIKNIIPIMICIGVSAVFTAVLNIDVFEKILELFNPLQTIAQTLPGFILIILIPNFFYSIGVSNWLFTPITKAIFMMGITANIALVEKGLDPAFIVTDETVYTAGLITMGGMGATLALNVLMLFSKSRTVKMMGRICFVPSIFNINEPLVYGAPIVMNPILMVPMWINSIVAPTIVWIVMKTGLLNIPSKMIQVSQIPAPFSTVVITEDWRGIPVYLFMFVVFFIIWYPFFKIFEKQTIEREAEEIKKEA